MVGLQTVGHIKSQIGDYRWHSAGFQGDVWCDMIQYVVYLGLQRLREREN